MVRFCRRSLKDGGRAILSAAAGLTALLVLARIAPAQEVSLISPENMPTWDKEMAKGFLPYHHLTALDFPVKRDGPPNVGFMLQPFMHCYYSIESKTAANGFVYCYVINWKVFSGFDRNASWRNPRANMKAALPYAQALLDLAEVRARQFGALKEGDLPSAQGATFEEARAHLQDVLAAFNHRQFWDMEKELSDFVDTTRHGEDHAKVTQLGSEIRKRLRSIASPNPHPASASPE